MNYRYIVDTNVLTDGKVRELIHTDFFRRNCIILEEIAFELLDTSLYEQAKQLAVPMDGKVLPYLAHVCDEMVKLGIVKTDEGNGDALLVAWGLMLEGGGDQSLLEFMREHPVVVTNETKVMKYAKTKKLDSINGDDFINIAIAATAATVIGKSGSLVYEGN